MALSKMLGCEFIIDDFFWQRKRATPNQRNTFSDAEDVTTSCVKAIDLNKALTSAALELNGQQQMVIDMDPFLEMGCGHLRKSEFEPLLYVWIRISALQSCSSDRMLPC